MVGALVRSSSSEETGELWGGILLGFSFFVCVFCWRVLCAGWRGGSASDVLNLTRNSQTEMSEQAGV